MQYMFWPGGNPHPFHISNIKLSWKQLKFPTLNHKFYYSRKQEMLNLVYIQAFGIIPTPLTPEMLSYLKNGRSPTLNYIFSFSL